MSDSEKSLAWEENLLGLDEQMALFLNPKGPVVNYVPGGVVVFIKV